MGFLTNISISNDFWHEIQKKPEAFVQMIGTMMNHGMNSPLEDMIDRRSGRDPWERRFGTRLGVKLLQGVTVHRARHYDEPQVIVNTYGSTPINAMELPTAIQYGWLDEGDYNEKHAEAVAAELHRLAAQIREETRAARKRREEAEDGASRDKRLDRPWRVPSDG